MELLRFFTAGNVDDGKSTLIGRLLLDSNSVSTDIIEALTRQSKTTAANASIDLALLTDGLRAEREQGITIDVAYKYFNTEKRKFIIADTPGHIQYTRNMFTGASNADLAIILVDVRNGITEQTRRHSVIAAILGISEVVICINKMDLADYSEESFNCIKAEYLAFSGPLHLKKISFIPVSALKGDNVVHQSAKMPWYTNKPLLEFLENAEVTDLPSSTASRFQVQYVIRPQTTALPDYRGLSGKVLSGSYQRGQSVMVLPSGIETKIERIEINGTEKTEAFKNEAIILHLKDKIDAGRGNSIVPADQLPETKQEITAVICWMDSADFVPGQKMLLQQNSFLSRAILKEIKSKIDIRSFNTIESDGNMRLNDICQVVIKTADPVSFDKYRENKSTGSFILINEHTNNTVAAGVIR